MELDPSSKDPIKEAFAKAKQDINELKDHVYYLYKELDDIKQILAQISQKLNQPTNRQANQHDFQHTNPAHSVQNQAFQHTNPAHNLLQKTIPADNLPLYSLKTQDSNVSIGNKGVPTDRQTDRQTDQHIGNEGVQHINTNFGEIQKVSQLLSSLDTIKQEVRVKFKALTVQEMLVFSTIYQLEEENQQVTYPLLASKLALTESSIRDYTQKLIKKGIPILKTKENNKKILLSISQELKKIASLSAILQLREI